MMLEQILIAKAGQLLRKFAVERDAKKWEPVFRVDRALNFWNRSRYLRLSASAQTQRDLAAHKAPTRPRLLVIGLSPPI